MASSKKLEKSAQRLQAYRADEFNQNIISDVIKLSSKINKITPILNDVLLDIEKSKSKLKSFGDPRYRQMTRFLKLEEASKVVLVARSKISGVSKDMVKFSTKFGLAFGPESTFD